MELKLTAEIKNTENPDLVKHAVVNIFGGIKLTTEDSRVIGSAKGRDSLKNMKKIITDQQIRDSSKDHLLRCIKGGKLTFELNKAAALMKRVNFIDFEVALGTIKVEIEDEDLEGLVDWLTLGKEKEC